MTAQQGWQLVHPDIRARHKPPRIGRDELREFGRMIFPGHHMHGVGRMSQSTPWPSTGYPFPRTEKDPAPIVPGPGWIRNALDYFFNQLPMA